MSLETFHIHLYGPPAESASEPSAIPTSATTPIPTSFEAAQERLEQTLSNVLLEPDGSFAWASTNHRVVGMIYDAAMLIQYVELRGDCDQTQLRKLVKTLSGTDQIDDFAVMVLPERQWKNFQSFVRSLPLDAKDPGNDLASKKS